MLGKRTVSTGGARGYNQPQVDARIRSWALTLWRYHHLHHELVRADAILVLCSHDVAVAQRGAQLWLDGWAPLLIYSGGLGAITREMWAEPEADQFAAIAAKMGVPPDQILIENQSTNTGENIEFTRRLLAERGLDPQSFIVVQKPYMERRAYATFKRRWPEKDVLVTSPQMSFDEYLAQYAGGRLSPKAMIGIMVGDLQRIRLYGERGFQIPQEIPADVWIAFEALVDAGYDTHLVKD
jgi:uncharacterized SAM-binding protein YcdF (DUF218 family)